MVLCLLLYEIVSDCIMIAVGTTKDIDIPKGERYAEAFIGKTTGLIPIGIVQIEEEHLYFRVKREAHSDNYEVTIRRGGPVLLKSKTGSNFEKMVSSEFFTDEEIKENGGLRFRLGDRIRDDEMKVYVEIGLNWDIDLKISKKKKRFFLTIEKIQGKAKAVADSKLISLVDPEEDEY